MKRKFSDSMVQQIVKEYLECRSPKCIFKKYGMEKGIKIICSSAIGNYAGIYPEYL